MFGSVLSAVEVRVYCTAYSTGVMKQNTNFLPMQALYSMLKARYGDRLAGHVSNLRVVGSYSPQWTSMYVLVGGG